MNVCRKHFVTEDENFELFANEAIPNAKVQISIIMKLADLHDGLVDVLNQINSYFYVQVSII